MLLLPFTKVKTVNYKKDSLGTNNERTLVSEFAIFAQKWLKFAEQNFFILGLRRSRELAGGGSVAVGVSDM